uniref:Cystatin domain-containing protein n=1 Tax=Stomoxys calcitrans TaxID=35570 RepID=A0A1I8QBS5_STOCA
MKRIFIIAILGVVCVAITARPNEGLRVGGVTNLEGEKLKEAEDVLENSLKKLAAGEKGPHYKLGKMYTASRQTVSGLLYKMNADIIDSENEENNKNCNVTIWSQPWLENGIKVTFNCGKDDELTFRHSA